jgi:hypothetical protein
LVATSPETPLVAQALILVLFQPKPLSCMCPKGSC